MAKRKPMQTSSHRIYSIHWCSKLMTLKVYNFPSLFFFTDISWAFLKGELTSPTQCNTKTTNSYIYITSRHLNPHSHSSSGKREHPSKRFSWWWPCRYTVFWVVVPCSVSKINWHFRGIYPDNRYTEFLQNVRTSLPCYMVSQPPKLYCSH